MARIVHEEINDAGSGIREFDDGTEEVLFSEAEWAQMLEDPKFGYVCQGGRHRMTDADHRYGGCMACEYEAEAAYYDGLEQAQYDRELDYELRNEI